jgi:hypothetical protein
MLPDVKFTNGVHARGLPSNVDIVVLPAVSRVKRVCSSAKSKGASGSTCALVNATVPAALDTVTSICFSIFA